ncbi:hypothetical protein KAI87_08940, partial [Myxococcota bacterium]|nr:hypothetical protein [Myxococcota bacterium]
MSRSLQIMISVFVALAVNFATVALLANLSARRAEVQKVEKKVKRNLQIARKPKAKRSRKPRKRMKQQTLSVPKNSALLTPGLTSSVQIPVMQAPDVANTDTRSALKEDIVFSEEMVDEPPTPKTHVS